MPAESGSVVGEQPSYVCGEEFRGTAVYRVCLSIRSGGASGIAVV
jgi:hypothetical protein